ncbi:MAG TPA: PfkB family carbohydrate kinase [Gemmatales bacterium]|nr:PfkB family carbohydrate kinase [Gemmatales bacterium]
MLQRIPQLTLGVVGDIFLDEYLELESTITEKSLETGLDAYQVKAIRRSPGAAGTILNNLQSLGVGKLFILTFIGNDGRGHDLKQALSQKNIDTSYFLKTPLRATPTYTKPLLFASDGSHQELNRLDIRNYSPTPPSVEQYILDHLPKLWQSVDALVILDQVSLSDTGVITGGVRQLLHDLGEDNPRKLLLADSRERIEHFYSCWTKPNLMECLRAASGSTSDAELAVMSLAHRLKRPVFCTRGEMGILLADTFAIAKDCVGSKHLELTQVPGYPVGGPVDVVGAGDSTSAGIACAYAAGATLLEAATFGNLIASITVQQIGTTGCATAEQVRERWQQVTLRN